MQNITLIGIDIGKHTFHVLCQDKSGKALLYKKFTRTKLIEFLAGCSSVTVVMKYTVIHAINVITGIIKLRRQSIVTP